MGTATSCAACPATCTACVTAQSCTACATGLTLNYEIFTCACSATQYYDTAGGACANCAAKCIRCTSSSVCLRCSILYELKASKTCGCALHTYSDSDSCKTCTPKCLTCTALTTCLACEEGFLLAEKQCTCPVGQFLNLAASPVACAACLAHCLICNSASVCGVCKTGLYFDGANCVCIPGYYPVSPAINPTVQANCKQCHPSCKTCNGPSSTNCLSCFEGSISSGACTCPAGTVRSESMPGGCTACPALCSACTDAVTCTGCTTPNNMIVVSLGIDSRCRCEGAAWLSGANCNACPDNCTACVNADTCLSCSRGTLFGNTCRTCPQNQYLDSANTCVACTQVACLVCPGDTCTQCALYAEISAASACNCLLGFTFLNGQCSRCPRGCKVCSSTTVCTECLTGFSISNGVCECSVSTNPANKDCVDCHMSCGTCNQLDYTKCLSCPNLVDFTFTQATYSCACNAGKFDAGNKCVPCKTGCTACTSLIACTACTANTNLAVSDGVCLCPAGQFYSTNTCAACTAPCTSCIGSATQCLGCPATMSVLNGKCFCVAGFY